MTKPSKTISEDAAAFLEYARIAEAAQPDSAALKQRYHQLNTELFNGELPDIPVEYAKLKTVGGVAKAKVKQVGPAPSRLASRLGGKHAGKELVPGSLAIQISSLYQRSPQAIDGILVHEMIHIWFFAHGDFEEDHGAKFLAMRKRLNALTPFDIPLTDSVDGLDLTDAPTRKVGAIILTKKGGSKSVAVVSEVYAREHLEALKERWAYFVQYKYVESVMIVICSGRIEARYPIQRKKPRDLGFFMIKDSTLLDEALNGAEILAEIPEK